MHANTYSRTFANPVIPRLCCTVQEAVKACLLRKFPDSTINVAVAASPDLAIVQGAAHYVQLEQKSLQYPVAPRYGSITAPISYGIMAAEVGQTRRPQRGIWKVRQLPSLLYAHGRVRRRHRFCRPSCGPAGCNNVSSQTEWLAFFFRSIICPCLVI